MSEYVSYSGGPGSIAALEPLAALSHAPTISSNDPRGAMAIANEHILGRDIKVQAGWTKGFADPHQPLIRMTHKAMPIRQINESKRAMGDGVDSSSTQRIDKIVLLGAMVAGVLYLAHKVRQERRQEREISNLVEEQRDQKSSTSQGPYM